jgi:hypothetical protein
VKEDATLQAAMLQRDSRLEGEWLRQDSLIYGGLVAAGVALVQPFLTAPPLDPPAMISVVAFSVAIPLLAALLMLNQQETFRRRASRSRVVIVTKVIAQNLSVLGVAAAFWHIVWIAGVGILASGLVAVAVHSAGFARLETTPEPPSQLT